MELVFLGTGHAHVTDCYHTCFALRKQKGSPVFLVDAGGGNGILTQLKRAGISVSEISELFISHIHTDHILGAVWVIRLFLAGCLDEGYSRNLKVYGNHEVISTLRQLCRMLIQEAYLKLLDKRTDFLEVRDGDVCSTSAGMVTFFDIRGITACQYGFVMAPAEGKKFVFTGDEPFRRHDSPVLWGADWAVLEATGPFESVHGHATIRSSCETAKQYGVKRLILTHTDDTCPDIRRERYTAEAKRYFSGDVYVPDDLDVLEIV